MYDIANCEALLVDRSEPVLTGGRFMELRRSCALGADTTLHMRLELLPDGIV